jgi:hypothetical protein
MTITDNSLRVSDAQSIAGAGPTVSTNSIDVASLDTDGTTILSKPDQGIGRTLCAQIITPTDADVATSIEAEIILASDAALTTGVVAVGSSGPILLADWNDDSEGPIIVQINPSPHVKNMDPNDATSLRYMGMRYSRVGTNPTVGTVTCDFVLDVQAPQRHHPTKFNIL